MGLAVNIASRIQNATKELNNSFIASGDVVTYSSLNNNVDPDQIHLNALHPINNVYL